MLTQAQGNEIEPNDADSSAQVIIVGRDNFISSTSNPNSDKDWYRFDGVAQKTYIIEIFDVSVSLAAQSGRIICENTVGLYKGLYLVVYNETLNEVERQCEPNGSGQVQTRVTVTPGVSGTQYIKVAPNSNSITGSYKIRVLSKYNEGADWDQGSFEPNNGSFSSYPIAIGRDNTLTSVIDFRAQTLYTIQADKDWFMFSGKSGETYVVDLLDVAESLSSAGDSLVCENSVTQYKGLNIVILNPSQNEIARQCEPNDSGNIHNQVTFTAGVDGDYFIRVSPNSNEASGDYKIRVRLSNDEIRLYLPLLRK